MPIKTVTLIGAGGNLGPAVLSALLPHFTVTILSRASSTSTFPPHAKVTTIPDDYPYASLVSAFAGQDAVVSTVSAASMGAQTRIVDAAIEAGVQRFLPAEFGPDTLDPETVRLLPVLRGKRDVVEYLVSKEGEGEGEGFSWTGVATSIFFDWALKLGFLKVDVPGRKAFVLDDGSGAFPATSLATVGRAVARVLLNPEETRNRFVYVQDFCVSPNQVVAELEKVTGGKFEVERQDSKAFVEAAQAKLNGGDYMGGAYDLIYAIVMQSHGWESKPGFANGLLELETANFEDTIKTVVAEISSNKE